MVSSAVALGMIFVLWASMHSLLASLPAKVLVRRLLGPAADRWYRPAYSAFALLSLLPLLWMVYTLPDASLYGVPAPWRWLMRAGQLLAALGFAGAGWQMSGLRFLGVTALFRPEPAQPQELQIAGFYRCMRYASPYLHLLHAVPLAEPGHDRQPPAPDGLGQPVLLPRFHP